MDQEKWRLHGLNKIYLYTKEDNTIKCNIYKMMTSRLQTLAVSLPPSPTGTTVTVVALRICRCGGEDNTKDKDCILLVDLPRHREMPSY